MTINWKHFFTIAQYIREKKWPDIMKGEYYMSKNYIYLDGKKIEISNETAENLRKEFGEYQFQHGDIVIFYGGRRIITREESGKLVSYDRWGKKLSTGQEDFIVSGYEKIGNVFEDTQ